MMANDVYKARARRLAAHLKTKHGVTLSHSAALEVVAAEEGARDWNTLAARSPADDSNQSAAKANVVHPLLAGIIAQGPPSPYGIDEGREFFGPLPRLHEYWPRNPNKHSVVVTQSIWDFVDIKPRIDHAASRLGQVVAVCIQGRRNDCARGAETGRLAATLLQKDAMGMLRGAEQVFEALEFPASLWRDACGQLGKAVDQATSELDADWRETARERSAARPADLKL